MKPRYRHAPLIDFEAPLPECAKAAPLPLVEGRKPVHPPGCDCTECWNAGLRYGDWLKQKQLNEL